jgi:hypothetical protein
MSMSILSVCVLSAFAKGLDSVVNNNERLDIDVRNQLERRLPSAISDRFRNRYCIVAGPGRAC